jgi:hypothetical protein
MACSIGRCKYKNDERFTLACCVLFYPTDKIRHGVANFFVSEICGA